MFGSQVAEQVYVFSMQRDAAAGHRVGRRQCEALARGRATRGQDAATRGGSGLHCKLAARGRSGYS